MKASILTVCLALVGGVLLLAAGCGLVPEEKWTEARLELAKSVGERAEKETRSLLEAEAHKRYAETVEAIEDGRTTNLADGTTEEEADRIAGVLRDEARTRLERELAAAGVLARVAGEEAAKAAEKVSEKLPADKDPPASGTWAAILGSVLQIALTAGSAAIRG